MKMYATVLTLALLCLVGLFLVERAPNQTIVKMENGNSKRTVATDTESVTPSNESALEVKRLKLELLHSQRELALAREKIAAFSTKFDDPRVVKPTGLPIPDPLKSVPTESPENRPKEVHERLSYEMPEYRNGQLWDGTLWRYWPNGKKKSSTPVKNGTLTGVAKEWHENGEVASQVESVDGKPIGMSRRWYKNGTLKYEKEWRDGLAMGVHRGWYQNGRILFETEYVNGKKEGYHRHWHENGQISQENLFKDDKLASESIWDELGNLLSTRTYK